jgi:hypothetical protein
VDQNSGLWAMPSSFHNQASTHAFSEWLVSW